MTPERHAELVEWLSSPDNPPVRYLTARDLVDPTPSKRTFDAVLVAV